MVEPRAAYAWAATSTWRGDLRLFARIARKAIDELSERSQATECCIEFAVRTDVERYHSVDELLERAPAGTLRSFSSARIRVGSPSFLAEVKFGRKRASGGAPFSCTRGVSVEVASDNPNHQTTVNEVRSAIVHVVARGGFARAVAPLEGPSDAYPDLEKALRNRGAYRRTQVQIVFAAVTVLTFLLGYIIFQLLSADKVHGFRLSFASLAALLPGVLVFAQAVSWPLSIAIFPGVEIADVTPERRILQVVGRSGIVTIITGVIGAYLKGHLHL